MPSILGYWVYRGLGQPIRLLLSYVGEEFEEERYTCGEGPEFSFDEWSSASCTMGLDFPNLPYYIDGDIKITQSKAILRYLGRKYDMVGSTEAERVVVDMMADQVTDFHWDLIIICYRSATDDDYEQKRDLYIKTLPTKLKLYEDFLGEKLYSAGQKITFPDFHLYEVLDVHKAFHPGCLDGFPKLQAFVERFETLPAIKKYMASDRFIKTPFFNKMTKWGNK